MNPRRYRPIPCTPLVDRTWPERTIDRAPIWCSVDLRDGNQALVDPMDPGRKLMFFRTLVETGIKEIEVGFPAASQTDFDFLRLLIEGGHIPDDVTIQVLTQAREPLIRRTVEAVRGARRVILHLYNSTSTLQRRVVFAMTRDEIRDLAVQGTRWLRSAAETLEGTEVRFEYSPESFTGTELDFAAEVVDAVVAEWGPAEGEKVIVNLPSTVELTTPNRYADQIEWMHRRLARRERILLSVHTHNDRGCAVAATELALLAGAERVEGTLFGNGERTGNVDLVTVALNMYSQGVDPGLDLSDLPALVEVFEHCNRLPVPARHPYAGQLVFTAFSGSHQDAIKKGLEALERERNPYWEVPYLPVDPSDLGREHENFIRINSQSGKGGVSFVMENSYGYVLPRGLAIEFSRIVQRITDGSGEELAPAALLRTFTRTYLEPGRLELVGFETERRGKDACTVRAAIVDQGQEREIAGTGNGPIDAFVRGLRQALGLDFRFQDYYEHALGDGADARALAYVQLRDGAGASVYGVGEDPDIVAASLQAVLHGAARMLGEMEDEAAS
jgi:2-isopropylmalate synthase